MAWEEEKTHKAAETRREAASQGNAVGFFFFTKTILRGLFLSLRERRGQGRILPARGAQRSIAPSLTAPRPCPEHPSPGLPGPGTQGPVRGLPSPRCLPGARQQLPERGAESLGGFQSLGALVGGVPFVIAL